MTVAAAADAAHPLIVFGGEGAIRSQRELRRAELAPRVGVASQTVIAIEQGRYSPSLEVAFQIARVFDVPIDEVFRYPLRRRHPECPGPRRGRFD